MYYNIFRGEDPFGVLATVDGIPLLPCASLYIIECLFNAIFTSCITAFTALTSPCWRVIWQILLNLKYVFLNHLHVQYIMLNTRDSSMSTGKVMPKKPHFWSSDPHTQLLLHNAFVTLPVRPDPPLYLLRRRSGRKTVSGRRWKRWPLAILSSFIKMQPCEYAAISYKALESTEHWSIKLILCQTCII